MREHSGKKLACVLLSLSLAGFVPTACSNGKGTDDTSETEPASPATAASSDVQDTAPVETTAPGPIINPTAITGDIDADVDFAYCEITGYNAYNGQFAGMFLTEGDRVAVIAPASLPSEEQLDATIAGLESWGYVPVPGNNVLKEDRTLEECREDLMNALTDPSIKAVFCVRGGYGSTEVMDVMTEDMINAIRNSNKLIIGFSDITVYHSAWSLAGIPSVHATMSASFTTLTDHCIEAEQNMLKGKIPSYRCETNEYCINGSAEGVLIGGNLSTMTAVINTAYDCTKAGKPYILFFEEIGEDIQHIHRSLEILKHAGVLDGASGIVFGEWKDIPADFGGYGGDSRGGEFVSVEDMIAREFLKAYNKPVAFGFPAGHSDTVNFPLLMGVNAKLVVSDGNYTLDWTGAK